VTDPSANGHPDGGRRKKSGFAFAHLAFVIALIPLVFLTGVMMATHVGYLDVDTGFRLLTLRVGPKLAMAALAVSALSLLISLFKDHARYGLWALGAVLLSGGVTAGYFVYERALKQYPPIADVATNWDTPVTFSDKLIADRGPKAMKVEDMPRVPRTQSMEWGGKSIAQINAMTCPGARGLPGKHVSEDAVADLLTAEHYVVFGRSPWRVEATYQDNFFGFKSDVVVRLDPERLDVRSTGRDDIPDLGGNCRRVTDLINKIRNLPDIDVAPPAAASASSPASAAAAQSGTPAPGGDDGGDE
jgi:fatty-acyl-CoA synthase